MARFEIIVSPDGEDLIVAGEVNSLGDAKKVAQRAVARAGNPGAVSWVNDIDTGDTWSLQPDGSLFRDLSDLKNTI